MRFVVVVVTWNGEPWIETCLESLLGQDLCSDVVVVDNASSDSTLECVERLRGEFSSKNIRMTIESTDSNLGFTRGANLGFETAFRISPPADAVLLLNQDAWLEPGCIASLADAMTRIPRGGAFGPKILFPESEIIQHAGGRLDPRRLTGSHYGHYQSDLGGEFDRELEVEYVTGAALAIRASALSETGPFDEIFSPGYFEDVEFCERLRRSGWSVWYVPSARARHLESASFGDGMRRLWLSHRNRFVYGLPRLCNPDFRSMFLEAETAHLASDAPFAEIRAISSASLWVLAHLDGLLSRCPPPDDTVRSHQGVLKQVFVEIRRRCAEASTRSLTWPSVADHR